MTPVIHQINDGSVWAIWVQTEIYDADYIAELKAMIKPRHRRWDSDRRVWLFKDVAVDLVCALLRRHFGGYAWAEETTTTALASVDAAYSMLCLAPTAPAGLVKAAYRWWAMEVHPDRGGDLRKMQDINAAVAMIEEHCA